MKTYRSSVVLNVLLWLGALLFASVPAGAKDVPVSTRSVQGRWFLLEVVTQDKQARAALLESKLDMTFHADKSVVVASANPESMTGTDSRKGSYRVEGGKLVITLEGEEAGEPARAVIRDGKHLVLLPSEKFAGEMIFAKVNEQK